MKLTEVVVSKGKTFNLGNYSSVRYEFGLTATFDEDDDVKEVIDRLQMKVNRLVEDETNYWEEQIKNNRR